MAATANRRKQDDKNLEILRELISINGNKYCLDCNQRGPTYVNATIGSFVCSKCSGMLRGLTPPHRVKSISMATFTPEEIEFIRARGNDYCRRVWLGLYEGESVNFTDEQSVRDFMSDKYEKKRYYLESAATSNAVTNGNSLKSKPKVNAGNGANSTPLILIAPQSLKSSVNNNNAAKAVNSFLPGVSEGSKVARPVNNYPQPLLSALAAAPAHAHPPAVPPPLPDFPVDFSKADIYNASQFNNNNTNHSFPSQASVIPSFNAFTTSTSSSNDRYAALAELDNAFKQQNMKTLEDTNQMNPFQSPPTNNLFPNKNPFFNGGWSQPAAVPVNPFMTAMNNGGFSNSNNPFL